MMSTILLVITILIFLMGFFTAKKLVRFVIKKLDDRIENYIDEEKPGKRFEVAENDIEKEIAIFRILLRKKRETKLGSITVIIGFIEFLTFTMFTTIILLNTDNLSQNLYQVVSRIGIVIPAWIALKIFGGYKQWSGAILGRSTYYIFLIGSIINILAGIFIGTVLYLLVQIILN